MNHNPTRVLQALHLTAIAGLLLAAQASATVIVNETFDSYNNAALGGQGTLGYGGTGWVQGSGTNTVQDGGLQYTGAIDGGGSYTVGATGGKSVLVTHTASTDPAIKLQIAAHPASKTATSTGKTEIWISYTLQVSNNQLSPIFYFDNEGPTTTSSTAEFGFGYDPTSPGGFNIRRGQSWNGNRIAGAISTATTYYIVGRQSTAGPAYGAGDDRWDRGELWINPVLNADGSLPAAHLTMNSGGNGQSDWSMIMFRFYNAATGRTMTIDNVAIGLSWADIKPGASLEFAITTASPLPAAAEEVAYSLTLAASGGIAPLAWALAPGSDALPSGLNLNGTTGEISGTPDTPGSYAFTVRVTDAGMNTADKALAMDVIADTVPVISTASPLAEGTQGVAYSVGLSATGGNAPLSWALAPASDPLPGGLTLSSGGVLSGTPTLAGVYSFTVRVTDNDSDIDDEDFELTIAPPPYVPPTITTASPLPGASVGMVYNVTLAASGGTAPLTWALAPGSDPLPGGLSLSAAGALTGTPDTEGAYAFTVRVTDNVPNFADKAFSLTVGPMPAPLLLTDSFDTYADGNLNGQGDWTVVQGTHTVQAGGLLYTGTVVGGGSYTVGGTGGKSVLATHSSNTDPGLRLPIGTQGPANPNELWISYTLQVNNNQLSPIFYFTNSTSGYASAQFGFGYRPDVGGFSIRRDGSWQTAAPTGVGGSIVTDTTYYIVGRMSTSGDTFTDAKWDLGELWVNPVLNPDGSLPAADMHYDTGGIGIGQDVTAYLMFRFYGGATGRTMTIDNLAASSNWQSIRPDTGEPPVQAPVLSGVIVGGNFEIGCPSVVGYTYHLEESIDDLVSWGPSGEPDQEGNGSTLTFTGTAPTSPGDRVFYRISFSPSQPGK